jgi:hypothetical protein
VALQGIVGDIRDLDFTSHSENGGDASTSNGLEAKSPLRRSI